MNMHFTYKDLFKAPRLAFSFKVIWIGITGMIGLLAVFNLFAWLATMVSGMSFSDFRYGLYALKGISFWTQFNTFGIILFVIGLLLSFAVLSLVELAQSRAIYMSLREELFYSWIDAYKWALKKWISVIGTYITFIILIVLFIVGALVMAWIGKIPYLGTFITSVMTIPYILAGMLLIYIFVGFVVSLFYAPAILASYDEDALGGVFQSFSILASQPFRTIWYTILTSIIVAIFTLIYMVAVAGGTYLFVMLFSSVMKAKVMSMILSGLVLSFKIIGGPFYLISTQIPAFQMGVEQVSWFISLITGISMFIMLLSVAGYKNGVRAAGAVITYVILEKLKDDENLLERRDDEIDFEEEDDETEFDDSDEISDATKTDDESGNNEDIKPSDGESAEENNKDS